MKKRVIILILAAVMLLAIPAQATSRATTFMPSLTFEGATAKCGIVILGGTHDQIEVTLSLWHGNQLIDTWSEEGTGVNTVKTCTLPIELEWKSPFEGGFLKWVNTNHANGTGAWEKMEAFKAAIDAMTITCTVEVQLASGAGA